MPSEFSESACEITSTSAASFFTDCAYDLRGLSVARNNNDRMRMAISLVRKVNSEYFKDSDPACLFLSCGLQSCFEAGLAAALAFSFVRRHCGS